MPEENTPAPDAEPGTPGTPTPTPEPSADMVDLQARLDASEAKVEAFGVDNQKLRKQRKTLKAQLDEGTPKPKTPTPEAPPSDPDHGFRELAISVTVERELAAQGANPKLVDFAAKAVDRDLIEVDGENIEGVAEAVAKLLKERPELMATKSTALGTINLGPGGTKDKAKSLSDYTRNELKAMSQEEFEALTKATPVVDFQMGDGPMTKVNISSSPNEAFERIHGVDSSLIDRISGGKS